ncbi:MAG: acyl-CoA thioesterase [Acidobacteria bacterium]|nr:acyl-CoA thioesterase [Acidobacteriota bacterium]
MFHFSTEVRVRLPETDAFGIVFHGYFFTYFDVARMDYLRNLGIIDYISPAHGTTNVVVHSSADFRSPARFDEPLVIQARISAFGTTSFTFEFRVLHKSENRLIATGKSTHVVLDPKTWKPAPVPRELKDRVEQYEGLIPGA